MKAGSDKVKGMGSGRGTAQGQRKTGQIGFCWEHYSSKKELKGEVWDPVFKAI